MLRGPVHAAYKNYPVGIPRSFGRYANAGGSGSDGNDGGELTFWKDRFGCM